MSRQPPLFHGFAAGLKVLLLTALMFVLFSVVYSVAGVAEDLPADPADQSQAVPILLAVCLLQTVALSLAVLRSRWWGWRLILVMFTVMFLITGVLSHIDTLYFLEDVSSSLVGKLVGAAALLAALFTPASVWILGRGRSGAPEDRVHERRSGTYWAVVLSVLATLHIVIYFAFGYYVVWQSSEALAFYGGEDPGSFMLQMASVVRDTPWLVPIQVLRGALWGLVAALLAGSLVGSRLSASLITAAVLVTLFALPLLIPNPLMPDAVRQVHLIETVLSRGLFGFLAVWILRSPHRSQSDHRALAQPKPSTALPLEERR